MKHPSFTQARLPASNYWYFAISCSFVYRTSFSTHLQSLLLTEERGIGYRNSALLIVTTVATRLATEWITDLLTSKLQDIISLFIRLVRFRFRERFLAACALSRITLFEVLLLTCICHLAFLLAPMDKINTSKRNCLLKEHSC